MGDIGKPRRRVIQVPATPIRRPAKAPSSSSTNPGSGAGAGTGSEGLVNPSNYIPLSARVFAVHIALVAVYRAMRAAHDEVVDHGAR